MWNDKGVDPWGMGGGGIVPQFLDWGGEYLIIPHF